MIDFTKPPSIFRRLAAITYDLLLLIAVLFLATLITLPLQENDYFQSSSWGYKVYLFFVSFLFYGWFWTRSGQTLGLIAWKIRVANSDGENVSWEQAFIRFTTAIFSWTFCGLGIIWMLFNKDRLMWHDMASKSQMSWKETE
jgi:uncharacterized RDD family membrane protein YckC